MTLNRINGRIRHWEFYKNKDGRTSTGDDRYDFDYDVIDACDKEIMQLEDLRYEVAEVLCKAKRIQETIETNDFKLELGLRLG